MRCDLPAGRRAANSRSMATFRRAVGEASPDSSHAALAGSSSSSAGSTTTSARASSPSSRSSGFVNAAWAGPRRPRMTTSVTEAAANAAIAWSAVSVDASSSGSSTSMRATSIATFPLPITTARSHDRSNASSACAGWPLYQATNSVAATDPGRSSPGIPSRLSVGVPTA